MLLANWSISSTVARRAAAGLGEDALGFGITHRIRVRHIQAMIAQAAADGMKIIVALLQRVEQRGVALHLDAAHAAELVAPGIPGRRLMHAIALVWAEGGIHPDLKAVLRALLVPGQRISGIVRGAQRLHLLRAQDVAGAHRWLREHGFRLLPDRGGRRLIQQRVDAEVALQFDMRPVIQRIAQRVRHGLRPGHELVTWASAARDQVLAHALQRMARHL